MTTPIYDDDDTGPRWTYLLTHRPPGYGHQPDGRIVGADKPDPRSHSFSATPYTLYSCPVADSEVYADDCGHLKWTSDAKHNRSKVWSAIELARLAAPIDEPVTTPTDDDLPF